MLVIITNLVYYDTHKVPGAPIVFVEARENIFPKKSQDLTTQFLPVKYFLLL
jgi:hypothetical protein